MIPSSLKTLLETACLQKRPFILAIDGPCASGKTTLALELAKEFDAALIHMDHFFLQPHQRTAERLAKAGGNLDRERFLEEVLLPLKSGRDFSYRPFDCKKMELGEPIFVKEKPFFVVEGTYSLHPALGNYFDLSVFLTVSEMVQRQRILERSQGLHKPFFEKWIPMENRYFSAFGIRERCDLVL